MLLHENIKTRVQVTIFSGITLSFLIRKSKIGLRLDFLIFCPFSASKLSYNFLKIDQEVLYKGANFVRYIKASDKVEARSFLKTFLIFTKYQPRLSYSDFLIKKTECISLV